MLFTRKNELSSLLTRYFYRLNQLQEIVFACFIKGDYFANSFHYENQIHQARIHLFKVMKKIRKSESNQSILSTLETLYEIIFSLNNLKLRVKDHATFEVCEIEIKKVAKFLGAVLRELNYKSFSKKSDAVIEQINLLSISIAEFEEIYQSTLQVVSYEPIVFLFFVKNLIAFRDEVEEFYLRLIK
ncbi:MAG: hypothetical protein ABI597_12820 [Gammaproteobacteria bacterium]